METEKCPALAFSLIFLWMFKELNQEAVSEQLDTWTRNKQQKTGLKSPNVPAIETIVRGTSWELFRDYGVKIA